MYNGRSAIEKRSILNETMSVNYELVYSLKYFCRSYENDLFPCNNKSILMSILLLFGIDVCMESNKINLKLLNFTFNGNNIPITMSHKHLGVTLSSDAKWNNHIENIILSVSRHLGILRKLKYRLSRQNLEKLYLVYIRPIFEYACEIWDNCGVCYSTKLQKLQLDAARIVTGLSIFTNTDKLYSDTG